ncbi:phosphoribosylglycinamide formyltransferase [Candidatus Peregrinibacteria bacterium]|nr:phosphoribosylglycinamide formyltransferase [Candidatus Peregrinibacteria bacterium]
MNFIVLSSSRGTTFQAVIDAMKKGELKAKCLGLISDRTDRGCVEKAKIAKIPVRIVEKNSGEDREDYDKRLHTAALELGAVPPITNHESRITTYIACIGWMFLLSPWFVRTWKRRMINVHPSLLPKYPGAHAIDDALAAGERETGMTIHYIDEGLDSGEIIVQKNCSIEKDDTLDSLKERLQALEKEWYPKVLQQLENNR